MSFIILTLVTQPKTLQTLELNCDEKKNIPQNLKKKNRKHRVAAKKDKILRVER